MSGAHIVQRILAVFDATAHFGHVATHGASEESHRFDDGEREDKNAEKEDNHRDPKPRRAVAVVRERDVRVGLCVVRTWSRGVEGGREGVVDGPGVKRELVKRGRRSMSLRRETKALARAAVYARVYEDPPNKTRPEYECRHSDVDIQHIQRPVQFPCEFLHRHNLQSRHPNLVSRSLLELRVDNVCRVIT